MKEYTCEADQSALCLKSTEENESMDLEGGGCCGSIVKGVATLIKLTFKPSFKPLKVVVPMAKK